MTDAVATDARGQSRPPAGFPGLSDGVLHCAVCQPAGVAPVQAVLPGLEELLKGGQDRVLLCTGLLGFLEIEEVASVRGLVREHHTWRGTYEKKL